MGNADGGSEACQALTGRGQWGSHPGWAHLAALQSCAASGLAGETQSPTVPALMPLACSGCTLLNHFLCLDSSLLLPSSTWQAPTGLLKPRETITSSPESLGLHLLSPYPCSHGAPLGREQRLGGLDRDMNSGPALHGWKRRYNQFVLGAQKGKPRPG